MQIDLKVDKTFNIFFLLLILSRSEGKLNPPTVKTRDEFQRLLSFKDDEFNDFFRYYNSLDCDQRIELFNYFGETDKQMLEVSSLISAPMKKIENRFSELWSKEIKRLNKQKSIFDNRIIKYEKQINESLELLKILFASFNLRLPNRIYCHLLALPSDPLRYGINFGKSLSATVFAVSLLKVGNEELKKRVILLLLHEIIHSVFETPKYRGFLESVLKTTSQSRRLQYTREVVINYFAPRGFLAEDIFKIDEQKFSQKISDNEPIFKRVSRLSKKVMVEELKNYLKEKKSIDEVFIKKVAVLVDESMLKP